MEQQVTPQQQWVRDHLDSLDVELPASGVDREAQIERIKALLQARDAVLVAHYYTDPEIQALAEETGGCVSDSLEMARFGRDHPASTLVVAGVKFMGETAKILSPDKRVLMPTLEATCSLDIGCPADEFSAFCDQHPDRTVVVYANTSAAVKARADWVVTSSIALKVVDYLDSLGQKILWAPDKHLGSYIQKTTGADMLLWDAACIVHEVPSAILATVPRSTLPDRVFGSLSAITSWFNAATRPTRLRTSSIASAIISCSAR